RLPLAAEVKHLDGETLGREVGEQAAVHPHGQEDRTSALLGLVEPRAARAAQRAGEGGLDMHLFQPLLLQVIAEGLMRAQEYAAPADIPPGHLPARKRRGHLLVARIREKRARAPTLVLAQPSQVHTLARPAIAGNLRVCPQVEDLENLTIHGQGDSPGPSNARDRRMTSSDADLYIQSR